MSKPSTYGARKARTTAPLKNTTARVQAALDFTSALALEYAQEQINRAGTLKVPAAGIMRRALAVYMAHLQRNDLDLKLEALAVQRAGTVPPTPADDQRAARGRMDALLNGGEVMDFNDVLSGPGWRERLAAINKAVDRNVSILMTQRRGLHAPA